MSLVEQVSEHLRREILKGSYGDSVPGARRLAEQLSIDMKTANSALKVLEMDGLLISQGAGRQRQINRQNYAGKRTLRIQIMLHDKNELNVDYHIDIRHRLEDAGHAVSFANKTLADLGMNVNRVARFIETTKADAWVVTAASRGVLEWFASQPLPAFALFGRFPTVPIAAIGPDKSSTLTVAVRHLAALGHRRIVMVSREARRKPVPAAMERRFLETLEEQGISVGPYNLPDWKESGEGLQALLESLFRHTPPTALILDGSSLFFATEHFLAQRGLSAPRNVSLMCLDPNPIYEWACPAVSHINWDSRPWVRRVLNWAQNVARGREDKRQQYTKTEFVTGGTIGPVPRS